VAEAKRQLGVRYTWAGSSPSTGFDCSGLTMWAWRAGGRSLPHSSAGQWSSTTHIPMSAIQPGDLIFYGHPVHHVGIYVGGGQIIHAPHEGGVVQYDSVYYWDDLVGAGRVG
jgi:cell wall-associated NlpC family hydrolase